ncbi:hypothetical protein LINPERPRIM_LOCUS41256 [Linum perenne]
MQSHPKASGLNNKPLPQWDDLCFIFGAQTPTGADAVQPGDETSRVNARARQSEYMDIGMEQVDSYTIPSNIDHNVVMEELINQGELAVRRQILYQELCTFPDLNQAQRRTIMRHLNRDDADATIYFQLPTSEEKLAFVRSFLE